MSLNLILLIGNVGRDAELRYTQNGRAVAGFSMAVNRNYQVNGEWQEQTEWFNVSIWGQQAERIANSIQRGNRVFVEGRLSTREFTNNAGITRTSLDVNAFRVINLSQRDEQGDDPYGSYPGQSGGQQPQSAGQQPQAGGQQPQSGGGQQYGGGYTPPTSDPGPSEGGFDYGSDGGDENLEDLPW